MEDVVIIGAARTPIGRFNGAFAGLTATQLGAAAIRAAVERAHIDPASVSECIMGNVVGAGLGQAPARQAALGAGLPDSVGALTINKVCGSGMKAAMLGSALIRSGERMQRSKPSGPGISTSIMAAAALSGRSPGMCAAASASISPCARIQWPMPASETRTSQEPPMVARRCNATMVPKAIRLPLI